MTTAVGSHLSHSQIQSFLTCPRKWSYEKIEQAPRERVPVSLAFGIAVHDTLAEVNEAALMGTTVNATARFIAHWKQALAGGLPMHFGKDTADDLLTKGQALVAAYQPPPGIIGVEQPFRITLDPSLPPVEGRIDLIRRDEAGDLVLVDLKTAGTRLVADTDGAEAQLGLYDLAYPAARHELLVLGKLKSPTITVQPITPLPAKRLIRRYAEVHHAMLAGVRYAARGWQCEGCPFAQRCAADG